MPIEPVPAADEVRTHWRDCWRFHDECKPRCEVCWEPVEPSFELYQVEVPGAEDGVIRGHRTCVEGRRTDA